MLTALHIQNFVLIEQVRLTMEKGLSVLTGETGAGKSILLDALGLAAGARAERGAVRQGAKQGVVAATFEVGADHPVWSLLDENGLADDDDQIILRRVQTPDGRTRGFVNDQPVSIAALRSIGEVLLEIHGQHDGRGFLSASAHRGMLDEFGGLEKAARDVKSAWDVWRKTQADLDERRLERDAAMREVEYLRHVFETLQKLDPQPDEETELADHRSTLMAAEKISEDLNAAASAFDEGRIETQLSTAARNIERARSRLQNPAAVLEEAGARLDAALNETGEARNAVAYAINAYGIDEAELEQCEERLFSLRAEARKHGVAPNELAAFYKKVGQTLDDLEIGEAAFTDLEKATAEAKKFFETKASALSEKRRKAAGKLDNAVAKELAPLKLGNAVFSTHVETTPDHPTSDGYDAVEFMVATNPGAPAGPLKTIASGGELSRFVLAMKAALAAKENRTVIIFDEVDAGVGGAVADAVGERLARLASDAQVLVVTHSPQVAARARAHWRIEKKQTKTQTTTSVNPLGEDERVEEIARMLSGAKVTDEARAAAKQLLKGQLLKASSKQPKKNARKKLAKAS